MKTSRHILLIIWIVWLLGHPATTATGVVFQTSITPSEDEDLSSACRYELMVPAPQRSVQAVWVIFDRGRDMLRYYGDPDVHAFSERHGWALLFAFHCRAKSGSDGDMNMDPAKGLGRSLVAALSQFAEMSGKPELASAKVVLLGFSGTGSLAGRFASYAPDRVLAVIASHAGHNPFGLETIDLSEKASAIPQLIIVGSSDRITGTERPYAYFRKHFDRGAPWTFVVQNKTPHCCVINVKALILNWLDAVAVRRMTRGNGEGAYGFIETIAETKQGCPNVFPPAIPVWCHGAKDTWGGENSAVSNAMAARRPDSPAGMRPAGWLPTRAFSKLWLSFVKQAEHPVTSLP